MEIDFNPSQIPVPRVSTSAKTPVAAADAGSEARPTLQGMAELQRKLDDLALTRPEKMDAARGALADVKYPPDELLNGISHLLAIHLDQ